MIPIETKRLFLRPLKENDFLHFVAHLPKVDRFLSLIAPKNETEGKQLIKKYLEEIKKEKKVCFAVELKDSAEFIGIVGVDDLDTSEPERHCWIKKEMQGKGYAFEAIDGFMKWANENLDYKVMYSSFDVTNTRMKRLNEKLGGVFVNEIPESVLQESGKILNIIRYLYKNPKS